MKLRGAKVYAYSVFHPFFEQFMTIIPDSLLLLGLACFFVLLAAFIFTGSLQLAAILALSLTSLLLNLVGAMAPLHIQLNAVSLVNLAMGVGIGLEFLSHIAHAFLIARGSRCVTRRCAAFNLVPSRCSTLLLLGNRLDAVCQSEGKCITNGRRRACREDRVATALRGRGAAVCSGIMITKFVGVAMLALSRTQIFEIYYFRMYMCLVVIGSFHGFLVLPVLLGLLGPRQKSTAGWRRQNGSDTSERQVRPSSHAPIYHVDRT
jgi:Niemann-Pick C1 protein